MAVQLRADIWVHSHWDGLRWYSSTPGYRGAVFRTTRCQLLCSTGGSYPLGYALKMNNTVSWRQNTPKDPYNSCHLQINQRDIITTQSLSRRMSIWISCHTEWVCIHCSDTCDLTTLLQDQSVAKARMNYDQWLLGSFPAPYKKAKHSIISISDKM